jgi:hypothetical protein
LQIQLDKVIVVNFTIDQTIQPKAVFVTARNLPIQGSG